MSKKIIKTEEGPIAIIGIGPIGQMIGAFCYKAGFNLALVDRLPYERVVSHGIETEGVFQLKTPPMPVYRALEEIPRKEIGAVVISTKAQTIRGIAKYLNSILDRSIPIIVAQNGLDPERWIETEMPGFSYARLVLNIAGGIRPDGIVHFAWSQPPNYLGIVGKEIPGWITALAEKFTAGGMQTQATNTIRYYAWRKVILNAALGTICAVTGQTMIDCIEDPDSCQIVCALLDEGIAAAKADGYDMGEGFKEKAIAYFKAGGKHKPSILLDLEKGLSTEVDEWNSRIAEVGISYKLPMTHHKVAACLIRAMERKNKPTIH